jgi:4-amino-4-deoxy-L-arabinose transferase
VLLTTIGIGLTYSITAYLIDKKAAWLAAFLYSINGLIVEIATGRVTTDHIDAFFLFFIELAIFFSILFVRKRQWQWNLLAGLSIGAAILSKWLPALIVLPVWLLLVMDSRSFTLKQAAGHFIVLAAACILVFLPWQLYIHRAFPLESAWEAEFTVRHAREAIEGHAGSVFYFVNRMRINYGELIYLPLFWFTWKSLATPLQYRRLAVLLWFWIPVIFFTFMKTKMQGYILFTAPALFMMTAGFWNWLEEWRKTHRFKWLSVLILFLIIALPVRYSIERLKPFQKTGRNPEWVTDLKALNRLEPQGGILFNYRRPVEAMFYTNFTVYPGLPDRAVLDSLTGAGNRVFINNIDSIPPALRDVPGAALIRLN